MASNFSQQRIEICAPIVPFFAIEINGRHRHDIVGFGFGLKHRTFDHGVGDVRVEHTDDIQRLHDVRAVVTTEAGISFKM